MDSTKYNSFSFFFLKKKLFLINYMMIKIDTYKIKYQLNTGMFICYLDNIILKFNSKSTMKLEKKS